MGRALYPLNNNKMKKQNKNKGKLWYVITCHHKHVQLGTESSFLIRLVDNLETAKELMQSIYDDAQEGRAFKYGIKFSNPEWKDEEHRTLQVTSDIAVGYAHSITIETYHLSDEWDFNVFSNKPWILE